MTASGVGLPVAADTLTRAADPSVTDEQMPLYRVGLYVEMDAEGGDYIAAAMGAAQALRRLGTVPSPFVRHPDAKFRVVEAMEVTQAAGNWHLRIVPPHLAQRGGDKDRAALVSTIERLERERDERIAEEDDALRQAAEEESTDG